MVSTLHSVLLTIYRNSAIRSVIQKLGIDLLLKDLYWWFRWKLDGVDTVTIRGSTATFESYSVPSNHERPVIEDILAHVGHDDVFFDIGADRGWYSCLVGGAIENGCVVAFEPHRSRVAVLKRNLARNGIRAIVQSVALSDSSGWVDFGYHIKPESSKVETQVRTVPGDELVRDGSVPTPTVIKIDVEGAELNVVRGLSETLKSDSCTLVYCELHDKVRDYGGTQEEVQRELRNHGFEIERIHTRDDQPFIRGKKS